MRYSPEQSEQTRQRILEACGREFRERGFGGVGVDALARSAGVTSGAFYNHFLSKADAFRAVIAAGVKRVRLAADLLHQRHGKNWLPAFATYYLGSEHRRGIANGCALPSLSSEVARADKETRREYQVELLELATTLASGMSHAHDRQAAWPLIAQLVGAVSLSRAVSDPALADEIASVVLDSVLAQVRRKSHGAAS
jgi:AcrR family transcriptional regulator